MTEEFQNPDGSFKGWLTQGERFFELSYLPSEDFRVTDCAALSHGDVIVLERRYVPFGILSRLKLVRGETVQPGASFLVKCMTRIPAQRHFEGIAVQEDPSNGTIIYLVSGRQLQPVSAYFAIPIPTSKQMNRNGSRHNRLRPTFDSRAPDPLASWQKVSGIRLGDSQSSFETESHVYPPIILRTFAPLFFHFGIAKADGEQAADVLAKSDLRGIDSHGVARLHTYEMLELGRINPKPKIKIVREKASVATVDGDNGLGLVVGPKANEIAMDKAEEHGSGWVSVCNTLRNRRLFVLQALERDLIGWAMTNSTKLVAPLGRGKDARHQSHRHRVPVTENRPSSSTWPGAVAYGKIEIALRKRSRFPKAGSSIKMAATPRIHRT